ncbi:GNAT family N-acetyltransferase [Kribbella italica]|uniref:Ribosomal protein S18 acetylase RimI-like enzyme n=1 Tax=Kribbella italica TaxID=1540520 RepID=A0A7W9JDT1_9ACTN|nr:GNAT family N-acetyltransferase [Kribbella italica]MBB5840140.1 ribosomal protein S18 acetylase RimI-like enzyme [Kribbella italica]
MDDLLRRWQYGWGLCRGLPPALDRRIALDVTLGLPHRDRELFALPGTTPAPLIAEVLHAPRPTWLTVTTHQADEAATELRSAGLELFDERKLLMTIDLRQHPMPTTQHQVLTTTEGPLERVCVPAWRDSADGEEAARGMMAVVGDDDAVMHDIHTSPAYRRQGLGTVVMGTLARRALDRGASTGLLMATVEGAALYRQLGWVPQATMLTAKAA